MIKLFYICVTVLSWLMWIEEVRLSFNHMNSILTAEEKAMIKANVKKVDSGLAMLKMFLLSSIPLVHLLILTAQLYLLCSEDGETAYLKGVEKTVRKTLEKEA